MQEPREDRVHRVEDVRQGQIILRKRWQRVVFISGLVAFVLLVLFAGIARLA